MAVLPENSIDLSGGVEFVAQPSLTWKIDRAAGRIAGTCDGYDAVKQAVEIILNWLFPALRGRRQLCTERGHQRLGEWKSPFTEQG